MSWALGGVFTSQARSAGQRPTTTNATAAVSSPLTRQGGIALGLSDDVFRRGLAVQVRVHQQRLLLHDGVGAGGGEVGCTVGMTTTTTSDK